MARLIRSLVVIGTIAIMSPVHEGTALRDEAGATSRTLLASLMPAVGLAQRVAEMEPHTRDMLLGLASAQAVKPSPAQPPQRPSKAGLAQP